MFFIERGGLSIQVAIKTGSAARVVLTQSRSPPVDLLETAAGRHQVPEREITQEVTVLHRLANVWTLSSHRSSQILYKF